MTSFDDKEKAAENKYAHELEHDFKLRTKIHRLLGLWAAAKLGLDGQKAEEYAKSLMAHDFGAHGEEKVVAQVKSDLLAHHTGISEHDIRAELFRLAQEAKAAR